MMMMMMIIDSWLAINYWWLMVDDLCFGIGDWWFWLAIDGWPLMIDDWWSYNIDYNSDSNDSINSKNFVTVTIIIIVLIFGEILGRRMHPCRRYAIFTGINVSLFLFLHPKPLSISFPPVDKRLSSSYRFWWTSGSHSILTGISDVVIFTIRESLF